MAEGGGLLNRYRVKSSIGGSNPPLSAIESARNSYPLLLPSARWLPESFAHADVFWLAGPLVSLIDQARSRSKSDETSI